jgi:uncharacterized protein (UPF0305 family)
MSTKMSDLMSAFDDIQSGKTASVNTGENKYSKAKSAYLEMLGETTQQVQHQPAKDELTEASKMSKLTAALQVIKETADTYENPEEAFLKIEKIVNACK